MRPLETKSRHEAKRRRNQRLIGIFIAFLMIASTIGYAILQGTEGEHSQAEYNNHKFVKTESRWQTQIKINEKLVILNTFYLPQELENITTQGKPLIADFKDKNIYIIADSTNERQAAAKFSILDNFILRMQLACSLEQENSSFCLENNLPVKTCNDADFSTIIIFLDDNETDAETEETETNIKYKNSCLIIKSKGTELIKATEKTIFMIFGIIS